MPGSGKTEPWLVRHPTEWRQIGIVATYWCFLGATYFVPETRNLLTFFVACLLSFLNAVVLHNHMHRGIFHSRRLNAVWRVILSFGNFYPASANVPGHNLVHHHFEDDGKPDWVAPEHVGFRWNLLNLIHFPNTVGPNTFTGVGHWMKHTRQRRFIYRYYTDLGVSALILGVLMLFDFWGALFFVFLPQLYGARGILRINLIQHDRTDTESEWNHSRNFVGRWFNWIMCNNGYHTIHHNRAGMHWSELAEAHRREVVPRIHPSLDEPSMAWYLFRTYVLNFRRPETLDVAAAENVAETTDLAARHVRRAAAEADAAAEAVVP